MCLSFLSIYAGPTYIHTPWYYGRTQWKGYWKCLKGCWAIPVTASPFLPEAWGRLYWPRTKGPWLLVMLEIFLCNISTRHMELVTRVAVNKSIVCILCNGKASAKQKFWSDVNAQVLGHTAISILFLLTPIANFSATVQEARSEFSANWIEVRWNSWSRPTVSFCRQGTGKGFAGLV